MHIAVYKHWNLLLEIYIIPDLIILNQDNSFKISEEIEIESSGTAISYFLLFLESPLLIVSAAYLFYILLIVN